MSSLQFFALWVGLLGGAAGFISVLLSWWQIRIDSPRIKLDLKYAYALNRELRYFSIQVINKGGKAVTINNVGIKFSNNNHSPFDLYDFDNRIGKILPFRLDSHSAETWLVEVEPTLAAIDDQKIGNSIKAYANLSTGKYVISDKIEAV